MFSHCCTFSVLDKKFFQFYILQGKSLWGLNGLRWWNLLQIKTDLVVPEVVHFTLEDGLPAVGDGDILHDRRKVRVESLWEIFGIKVLQSQDQESILSINCSHSPSVLIMELESTSWVLTMLLASTGPSCRTLSWERQCWGAPVHHMKSFGIKVLLIITLK